MKGNGITLILLVSIRSNDEYVDPRNMTSLPYEELDFSHIGEIQSDFKALEMALFTKFVTKAAKRNM